MSTDLNTIASRNEPVEYDGQPFAKSLKIGGKQTINIEIPVETAANFGVTFMSDPTVSVSLIDASGAIVDKDLAGSMASRGWFRSLYYDKPVSAGTWQLKIVNTSDLEHPLIVTTWNNARR